MNKSSKPSTRPRLRTLLASILTLLAGCASAPPKSVAERIEVKDSQFDAVRTIVGPTMHSAGTNFRLRAFKPKAGGETRWQLYADITWMGDGWRFYNSASFEDGMQASATRISTDVTCGRSLCTYQEIVGVIVPAERIKPQPFSVRINSRSGRQAILTVPADYIAAMIVAAQ
jgi:hypothetical protein